MTLTRAMRLTGTRQFRAVYEGGARFSRGGLVLWSLPNGLALSRLGLSVPRHIGGAVTRNRIKRRLRECFRQAHAGLPPGYDLVIAVRRHDPGSLEDSLAAIFRAASALPEARRCDD